MVIVNGRKGVKPFNAFHLETFLNASQELMCLKKNLTNIMLGARCQLMHIGLKAVDHATVRQYLSSTTYFPGNSMSDIMIPVCIIEQVPSCVIQETFSHTKPILICNSQPYYPYIP